MGALATQKTVAPAVIKTFGLHANQAFSDSPYTFFSSSPIIEYRDNLFLQYSMLKSSMGSRAYTSGAQNEESDRGILVYCTL